MDLSILEDFTISTLEEVINNLKRNYRQLDYNSKHCRLHGDDAEQKPRRLVEKQKYDKLI